jgi:hypothetical protein
VRSLRPLLIGRCSHIAATAAVPPVTALTARCDGLSHHLGVPSQLGERRQIGDDGGSNLFPGMLVYSSNLPTATRLQSKARRLHVNGRPSLWLLTCRSQPSLILIYKRNPPRMARQPVALCHPAPCVWNHHVSLDPYCGRCPRTLRPHGRAVESELEDVYFLNLSQPTKKAN